MLPEPNRYLGCGEINQHVLDFTFQNLLALNMNVPIFDTEPQFIEEKPDGHFIEVASTVEGVRHILRVLKMKEKKPKTIKEESFEEARDLHSIIFCRPVKEPHKDEKTYWLVRDQHKKKLKLDLPIAVLVLPNDYILTVERKYINLYEVDDSLSLTLKDFDSTGIGKKVRLVDMKNVCYKNREYVIIFVNEK